MKKLTLQFRILLALAAAFLSMASSAQDKGVLLVNEFSNGRNGSKEWVELLVANNIDGISTTVDITGWLVDDNNGIFNGTTGTGAGISGGHLRFADSSIWEGIEAGTYIVLFNGNDFDSANINFVNANAAADGVYAVNNAADSTFVFVAVGVSPYIHVKTNTPSAGLNNNKRFYCDQNGYQISVNAWNSVSLRNDSLGDGFQVRCPGCIDNPNFSDDPNFYHGASYGGQMGHVIPDSTVGLEGAWVPSPDSLGGAGRAFAFFQGTGTNDIGIDSNWQLIPDSLSTPGFANSSDNSSFRDNIAILVNIYPVCDVFVPDTTPVRGVLVLTEFSNGPSGNCEYIELLVAPCNANLAATEVDIREWIVDDNNGVFGAGSGKGITTGHLKFANIEALKTVPVGTVIVLYNDNGTDNCYGFAKDEDYSDNTLVLPIDGANPTSFVINNRTATGLSVKPTTSDSTYCPAAYESSALDWGGRVGIGNTADGVQVRCPGCEPVFYHGAAYGTALVARAQTGTDLGGPKLASGSQGGKTFILTSGGCDAGNAANWTIASAPAGGSVPVTAGVVDTAVYNPIIVDGSCSLPCCPVASGKSDFSEPVNYNGEEETFAVGDAYPNPATNSVSIEVASVEDFTVNFIDVMGREVYRQSFKATQGTTVTVDLSGLAAGTYFFNVVSESNKHTGRVVISK